MKLRFRGRELHVDRCSAREAWDMAVLIQSVEAGEGGEAKIRNSVVIYEMPFGVLAPASTDRRIRHLVVGRLMVSFYGRQRKPDAK